jgi:hypothetical protein
MSDSTYLFLLFCKELMFKAGGNREKTTITVYVP